ncbi:hypothetical protein HMPREF3197_01505, partial [Klebsiella pneumoniae]
SAKVRFIQQSPVKYDVSLTGAAFLLSASGCVGPEIIHLLAYERTKTGGLYF